MSSLTKRGILILYHVLLLISIPYISKSLSTTAAKERPAVNPPPPPIVYTIAGSDSGGGAGIQADLHAIHTMGCHACSAITCLTAQNSCGVTDVHVPPVTFLRRQLQTLKDDLYPRAIKIGMLGTKELAMEVGMFLREVKKRRQNTDTGKEDGTNPPPFVVLDPVMISTSGHKLIEDDAKEAIVEYVFPYADVLTPNKFEAEELLGRELKSPQDVERGAQELLSMGVKAVLIKGGHSLAESSSSSKIDDGSTIAKDVHATIGYAQDYFVSSEGPLKEGEERLCDGCRGVWLRTKRYDSSNTHGTGCTLSSAITSALAIGHQQREFGSSDDATGAARAIYAIDACCLAKAYVTAGIEHGVQFGKGPGPVAHTSFPSSYRHFPVVAINPKSKPPAFLSMRTSSSLAPSSDKHPVLGKILPIVDSVEWVERLAKVKGVTDVQLRVKDETDPKKILEKVQVAQAACEASGVRLWINDYWEVAIEAKCFGVHMGQEDLAKCVDAGGLTKLHENNLALGVSTHSYAELSAALGVRPSYISLGPVFATSSKKVAFYPQGISTVKKWRELIDPEVPLVVIGGINDADAAKKVREAGAECVAVIGAITQADDVGEAVEKLDAAME